MYGCDGRFVLEHMVDFHDQMQVADRCYHWLMDYDTRVQRHRSATRENTVLRALLTVAARSGDEERAAFFPAAHRNEQPDEAGRIAADHGFGPDRLIAMKGLARSRGVGLETVLRAALRGEFRSIVELPVAHADELDDAGEQPATR